MIYFTDTNILLRVARPVDPLYRITREAVRRLEARDHQLQTTSQNFAEFWNVSTRPADQNGFGNTLFETEALLRSLEEFFPLLPD